jgi:hypothetical protein
MGRDHGERCGDAGSHVNITCWHGICYCRAATAGYAIRAASLALDCAKARIRARFTATALRAFRGLLLRVQGDNPLAVLSPFLGKLPGTFERAMDPERGRNCVEQSVHFPQALGHDFDRDLGSTLGRTAPLGHGSRLGSEGRRRACAQSTLRSIWKGREGGPVVQVVSGSLLCRYPRRACAGFSVLFGL